MAYHPKSKTEGEQDGNLSVFKPLLASLWLGRIPSLASAVRTTAWAYLPRSIVESSHHHYLGLTISVFKSISSMTSDGSSRFLATGYCGRFDGINARVLASEAQ